VGPSYAVAKTYSGASHGKPPTLLSTLLPASRSIYWYYRSVTRARGPAYAGEAPPYLCLRRPPVLGKKEGRSGWNRWSSSQRLGLDHVQRFGVGGLGHWTLIVWSWAGFRSHTLSTVRSSVDGQDYIVAYPFAYWIWSADLAINGLRPHVEFSRVRIHKDTLSFMIIKLQSRPVLGLLPLGPRICMWPPWDSRELWAQSMKLKRNLEK
jgi:hypothetical protein